VLSSEAENVTTILNAASPSTLPSLVDARSKGNGVV
jgi:hypothetical protein